MGCVCGLRPEYEFNYYGHHSPTPLPTPLGSAVGGKVEPNLSDISLVPSWENLDT